MNQNILLLVESSQPEGVAAMTFNNESRSQVGYVIKELDKGDHLLSTK